MAFGADTARMADYPATLGDRAARFPYGSVSVRRRGLAAYCGGACNETDRSAQVMAHVAVACGADQILAAGHGR